MGDLIRKIKRAWGWIFRALTIAALTFAGYTFFDPGTSVGDIPFAELTLKDIFGRIASVAVILGGLAWFFSPPEQLAKDNPYADEASPDGRDPFIVWGKAGGWCFGLALFAYAFFRYHS